ncbi:MAG: hypothetical protein ACRDHZ_22220, partial [Ktedonobacteraceae bacterium]
IGELDIERIKPPMQVDRVFKVWYLEEVHVLHLEFETGAGMKNPLRLLAYNALLTYEYELPVISMIVYPFQTEMATSPLVIKSGEEALHTFHFRTLPLFTLEAKRYIRKHITCMYPLIPAMSGANAEVIVQAMTELSELYQADETTLAQEFAWMQVLLERVTIIPDEEKAKIGDKLKMYDSLWEEHPRVKKIKAEAEAAKAEARAKAKAEAKAEIEAETEARVRAEIEAEAAKAKLEAEVEAAKVEVEAAKVEVEAAKAKLEAEAEAAKAKAEAEAKAAREAVTAQLQRAMVYIVKVRFPELTELAQQSARQIKNLDVLGFLLDKIEGAESEAEARRLLLPPAA